MRNKRIRIICVALALFAIVASVAFSQSSLSSRTKDGVIWVLKDNTDNSLPGLGRGLWLEVYNSNNYKVRVYFEYATGPGYGNGFVDLAPGETYNASASRSNASVKSVVKM